MEWNVFYTNTIITQIVLVRAASNTIHNEWFYNITESASLGRPVQADHPILIHYDVKPGAILLLYSSKVPKTCPPFCTPL